MVRPACRLAVAISLLLSIFTLSGCMTSNINMNNQQSTSIRFVQGDASAQTIKVVMDGATIASNLAYLHDSGYLSTTAGTHQITIQTATGALTPSPVSVNLTANSETTLVIDGWGSFSFGTMLLTDDRTSAPNSAIKLRILDGALSAPGVASVDVFVLAPGVTPGGSPFLSNVSFNDTPGYQTLPPGTYDISFTASGSTQTIFHTGPLTFAPGENRTLVFLNNCLPNSCDFSNHTFVMLSDMD